MSPVSPASAWSVCVRSLSAVAASGMTADAPEEEVDPIVRRIVAQHVAILTVQLHLEISLAGLREPWLNLNQAPALSRPTIGAVSVNGQGVQGGARSMMA